MCDAEAAEAFVVFLGDADVLAGGERVAQVALQRAGQRQDAAAAVPEQVRDYLGAGLDGVDRGRGDRTGRRTGPARRARRARRAGTLITARRAWL